MYDRAPPTRWAALTLASLALVPVCGTAGPITSDAATAPPAVITPGTTPTERTLLDAPGIEALGDIGMLPSASDVRLFDPSPGSGNNPKLFDPGDGSGGLGAFDALRGLANVAPTAAVVGRRANNRPTSPRGDDPLSGIDLGPEAREWMRDTFKGIVDSVLQIDVNEKGRASFSVLGMGEFGIAVSADRTQIALTSGDDVLLTAQRAPDPGAGAAAGSAWSPAGTGAAAGGGGTGQSPLKKALELVFEIATHPVSLLVYLIVAAYTLLWSVLSRQPRRKSRHSGRRSSVVAHPSDSGSGRSRRRRHRIRRHRHA